MGKTLTLVLAIFLLFSSNGGFAQDKPDPHLFDSLTSLVQELAIQDPSRAQQYLTILESFSDKLSPLENARVNYLRLMILRGNNADYDLIEQRHFQVPDSLDSTEASIFLAGRYLQRSMPDKAVPLLLEVLRQLPEGSERESFCRIKLSEAYRQKQEYAKAFSLLSEILSAGSGISDLNRAYAYNRLAAIYNESGKNLPAKSDSVIKYSELAINMATRINSMSNLALAQNELSVQMRRRGAFDKALELTIQAVENFLAAGDTFNAMNALINQSEIYRERKEFEKAFQTVVKATNLCHIEENRNLFMRLYLQMALISEMSGHYQEAYGFLKIARWMQVDFFKDRINLQINEQSARYDLMLKEKEITQQKQRNVFYQRQSTLLAIVIAVLMIVFVITILLFRLKRKEYLKQKLMEAVIETESMERKRIARDLHDGLGPLLSAVNLYFQAYIDATAEERQEIQEKTQQVILDAVDEVSRISHNISPHILENYGLGKALYDFIAHLRDSSGIQVFFDCGIRRRFEANKELTVYRCLTELMSNTIKHAHAAEIRIAIRQGDKLIEVLYSDNGKGFSPGHVNHHGMGLNNIRNRVETFGGRLSLNTRLGQGVKVKIEIPVQYEKDQDSDC